MQLTRPHSRASHRVAPFRIDSRVTDGSFPRASSHPCSQRAPHCSSRLPSSTTIVWSGGASVVQTAGYGEQVGVTSAGPPQPSSSEACGGGPTSRRHCSPAAVDCPPIAGSPGPAGARTRERERSPADESSPRESPQASEAASAAAELGLTPLRTRPARSRRSRPRTALATGDKRTEGNGTPTGTRLPTRSAPPRPRSLHRRRQGSTETHLSL